MQTKMIVPALAHSLTHQNRGGEENHEEIFSPKALMRIPVNNTDCVIHPWVYELLSEGTLVVKSSSSSKSLLAGVRYVIAKPVDSGFAFVNYYLDNLANVKKLLAEGWKICRYNQQLGGYMDVLTPSDSEYLVEQIDLSMRWREAVAAVINCEIERNCNWSSNRFFDRQLAKVVKETKDGAGIVVPEDCPFMDTGETVTAEEFVSAYVLRGLESYLNVLHEFVKEDQNALYVAEAVVTGVQVNRYTDVRAIMWHLRDEQERAAREQALEEGLGG